MEPCLGKGCGARPATLSPLPLTEKHIGGLASDWGALGLWRQVEWAADVWWTAQQGYGDETRAWVHLLLAVGNFKRQAPIRSLPEPPATVGAQRARPSAIAIPGTEVSLRCGDEQSWTCLEEMRGMGVATSTTLLSALWPGCHVVIDILGRRAAVGLALTEPQDWFPESEGTAPLPPITWEHYGWYRSIVLRTAQACNTSTADVERALFVLAKRSRRRRKTPPRTWFDYQEVLLRHVGAAGDSRSG